MKLSIPHWILVALTLISTEIAPKLGGAFPSLAPYMSILAQLAGLAAGALGVFTASAVTSTNISAVNAVQKAANALPPLALLAFLTGCGANSPTPAQQAEVVSYAAQEQACVALATTEDAADKCIAQVRALYCGPFGVLREAGACSYDGGIADAGGQ